MTPIKRIITFCILTIIFCQFAFIKIKKQIDKYQSHDVSRFTELLYNTTPYDVLFLGSSRTHLIVNPKIIDRICNVNSYNAGIEGANLLEFKMMIHAYLENHIPPKWLVLTLDLHSFIEPKFFNYVQYFSFTKNNTVKKYLNDKGYSTLHLKFFPFMEMTDYDDNTKGFFVKGLLGKSSVNVGDFQYKGYLSNTKNYIIKDELSKTLSLMPVTDLAKIYLSDILQTCKLNNIKLIFTYAPEYKHKNEQSFSNSFRILAMIDSIAKQNKISFLRDDSLNICYDPRLFANIGHLNRKGADQYSEILAKELNTLMSKN